MMLLAIRIGPICLALMGQGHTQELRDLIELAHQNNPGPRATREMARAQESLVVARATLDSPMVGISTLDRNVKTQYGSITQKIRFPVKYYLQMRAQRDRARGLWAQVEGEKLQVRQRVISLYFSIYSTQKIIELTRANIQIVREFARVAEKKYAAGKSPQGDSMKAHFELTRLGLDLIELAQREEALQDELRATVNDHGLGRLRLEKKRFKIPEFQESKVSDSLQDLDRALRDHAPELKKELHLLEEARAKRALSKWEFAPDFQLQYQQRIAGKPADSKIFSVAMAVPLWFWRKRSEAQAATSYTLAQQYRVDHVAKRLMAQVQDLKGQVQSGARTLKIYQTGLIPQAQGAYNSTRAAYRAHKTSFLDLLDSERSLYRVQRGFYQALERYIKSIAQLESQLGFRVSDLEKNSGVSK